MECGLERAVEWMSGGGGEVGLEGVGGIGEVGEFRGPSGGNQNMMQVFEIWSVLFYFHVFSY